MFDTDECGAALPDELCARWALVHAWFCSCPVIPELDHLGKPVVRAPSC